MALRLSGLRLSMSRIRHYAAIRHRLAAYLSDTALCIFQRGIHGFDGRWRRLITIPYVPHTRRRTSAEYSAPISPFWALSRNWRRYGGLFANCWKDLAPRRPAVYLCSPRQT
ncbi:hypothetical protein KCP77_24545 [Salmonella enterica subsp. enterica]|nr:hypothetical protein KCP77_24545 [Salmonella enterica subsp. enterica]